MAGIYLTAQQAREVYETLQRCRRTREVRERDVETLHVAEVAVGEALANKDLAEEENV